ncbi:uncharacterized protein LOC117587082 [Drosophila guanche]|uniref:Uncharacterized protein n=1 Tax=Drosophila guanche TaxID=7266 RepID=A0A3B0KJU5_DROGU|nr:uncharacterized protein LOC117587082 [Drosophila guanche]SPP85411.1 Hypothetical predicted protein [Drosophila guanche]
MTSRWLFLCLLLYVGAKEALSASTVMDNLGDGLKMAGQMFGINTAADVANLVAQAFSRGKPSGLMNILQHGFQPPDYQQEDQSEQQPEPENAQEEPPQEEDNTRRPPPFLANFDSGQMLTNMLRMVGFDARKLGALALNALIMIAQAIGSTLMQATRGGGNVANAGAAFEGPEALYEPNDHQPRDLSLGSPIDWFLQRPGAHSKRLLDRIMDKDLPEQILDMIESKEDREMGHEAGCLKMLMCKSKPIIWGMQNSLQKRLAGEPELPEEQDNQSYFNKGIFFKYLPSLKDFREHSAGCETRFNDTCPRNATTNEY